VLHVNDDVGVVDQHPPAVALALPAYRLGADVPELVLHLIDDRLHLPVVGRGAEHEGVGDDELVGDVEGDDVVGELVGRCLGGGADELEGAFGGGHGLTWIPSWCCSDLGA
jgi:hypothetical protein